jgi:acyl-coenzyme A thioesterase PaaI-like protein
LSWQSDKYGTGGTGCPYGDFGMQPTSAETIKWKETIEKVPFNAQLGVQVLVVEPGRSKCKLAFRPELSNHVGTLHAAAQFGLIEAASGAVLIGSFAELLEQATPLATGAEIAYRSPAHGDSVADAIIDPEDIEMAKSELATTRKARVNVRVNLVDSKGTISTEATVHWHIRLHPVQK